MQTLPFLSEVVMKTKDRVVAYLKRFPNARTIDIAKALKVNPSFVSTIRNSTDAILKLPLRTAVSESPIQLSIDIGHQPAVVKLTNNGTVIGTLTARKDGMSYKKANAKKDNGRLLRWEIIEHLQIFGIISNP